MFTDRTDGSHVLPFSHQSYNPIKLARKHFGFTLPELLIVLAISTILISLSSNYFGDLINSSRSQSAINEIESLVQLTRNKAVTLGKRVTLCATDEDFSCKPLWQDNPVLIFVDTNNNKQWDSSETLVYKAQWPAKSGYPRWNRSSGYIRFLADGRISQTGTLLLCPRSGEEQNAHALIINSGGRVRRSSDSNNDNIREDASGNALDCSWVDA